MAQVRWTQEAERWLEGIFEFISADNPAAAVKVVKGIHRKIEILSDFPAIGHLHRADSSGDIRVLLFGHYRIAYRLRPESDLVEILGVFHGAMDISRYL